MTDQPQKIARRSFVADAFRAAGALGLGGAAVFLAARRGGAERLLWQIDPDKCIACDRCQTQCVLDVSAVKSVQCFALCGYCDVCTGYFPTKDFVLETGAENQLCPTGAITREFIEEKGGERFFEYTIRESLCIGCGKCVAGCRLMNGSLYLQIRHDRCLNCNECAIAVACPTQAISRVPAGSPNLMSGAARAAVRAHQRSRPGATSPLPKREMGDSIGRLFAMLIPLLLPLVLLTALATRVSAGELIPVPSFSHHEIPQTQNPAPRAEWREYADIAALAAGLCLASYLALVRRSRRGLFLLAVASLAWLGFWRKGCICPIGAIENVTLAVFDPTYAVPLSAMALFALPIVFTLLFGRTFCASVCPLGAVQELVAVRPVKVPLWLEHALGLLAYVYLGAAVLLAATDTAFVICRYDPFVALFRLSGERNMLILGGCFLAVGLFVGRPYCRYLCPYGAILGLASRVAKWHVQIPPEECIQCRLCEDSCPYNAIREPTVALAAAQRRSGRRRLAMLIVLLSALVGMGWLLGSGLGPPLASLHPTVHLAQRLRLEQAGQVEATSDASEAFRQSGRSLEGLYGEADELTARLGRGGAWFGAWVGLVIGLKLIHLSVRRRRTDYQPDRTNCVACGRCFWYCPGEQARQGWIQGMTAQ